MQDNSLTSFCRQGCLHLLGMVDRVVVENDVNLLRISVVEVQCPEELNEEKAALARQQGVQGALNFVQQGVSMLPMFGASGTHTDKLFTPEALNTATPATARSQALAQQFPNLYGNNTPGAPLQFGGNSNFSRFTRQMSGLNYQPSTNLNPFAITNSGFGGYGSGYGGFGGVKFP